MRYVILILSLMSSCATEPDTAKVESDLCTIQDQLDGVCSGPFALLPQYTRAYAHDNTSAPSQDIDNNSISCGVIGGTTVMCVLDLDFPTRMTVICTKEGSSAPVCHADSHPDGNGCGGPPGDPCIPPFAPTGGGKGTNFCTVEDQIEGRCAGPFSLLADYTRTHAAQEGYSNVPETSLECGPTPLGTSCVLTLDVPGYKIVVTCEQDNAFNMTSCTTHVE